MSETKESIGLPKKQHLKKRIKLDDLGHDDFMGFLENPDKILRSQGLDYEAYDNMMEDADIFSAFDVRDAGVLSREWTIEQNNSKSNIYEFIKEFFERHLNYRKVTKGILKAPRFGFQPITLTYDYIHNQLAPVKIDVVNRKHFSFDKDGVMFANNGFEKKYYTEELFFIPRYEETLENPYGQAILSKCFWPHVFKKEAKKYWSVFIEKYGIPWATIYLNTTDADDITAARKLLADMVQDAVLATNYKNEIKLENGASTANSAVFKDFILDAKGEISKVILGHDAATSSTPGKLGNENMAASATANVIDSDSALIVEQYNKLIQIVCKINWPSETELPKFKFVEEEHINLDKAELLLKVKDLRESGHFSDDLLMREFPLEEGDLIEAVKQEEKKSSKDVKQEDETPEDKDIEESEQSGKDEENISNTIGTFQDPLIKALNKLGKQTSEEMNAQGVTIDDLFKSLNDEEEVKNEFIIHPDKPINTKAILNMLNDGAKIQDIIKADYFNSQEENTKDQQIIDEFIETIAADEDNNKKFFGSLIEDIMNETKEYDDLEKLEEDYHKFYEKMNGGKLEDRIISVMLASYIAGLHSVNVEQNEDEKEDNQNLSIPEFYAKVQEGFIELKDLLFLLDKDPDDILAWFESKEVVLSDDINDTIEIIRKHAFTVTGVTKLDMLYEFKKEISKAIRDGNSFNTFQKNIRSTFEQKGWMVTSENDKLVAGHRIKTVFRTNLQRAYMEGRWNREMATVDLYPYVQCISVIDPSTTKACKALNLKVFSKTDEFYQKYLRPPGHYNCRRRSRSLDKVKVDRLELTIDKGVNNKNNKNAKGFEKTNEPWKPSRPNYPVELEIILNEINE